MIGAEKFSSVLNPDDRTTSILFGDGAGAVVVSAVKSGNAGELLNHDYHSNESERDVIIVPRGGAKYQNYSSIAYEKDLDHSQYFIMDGKTRLIHKG